MAFQNGDILACYGADWGSRGISLMTAWPFGPSELWWPPSHVGMITTLQDRPVLVESTQLCRRPCLIHGERIAGVQCHEPNWRIQDYLSQGGRVDVYRLSDINRLTESREVELQSLLINYFLRHNNPYDTIGAALSGTRIWQLLGLLFPRADLHSVFCSELIAAVLQQLGLMNRSNPGRYNPGRLLRELVWTGVYARAWSAAPDSTPRYVISSVPPTLKVA